MAGERVGCVVSVQMLTEGWDVKSVSHVLGIRAPGSPVLTEQITHVIPQSQRDSMERIARRSIGTNVPIGPRVEA
jgi:hypothetical protein